MRGAKRHWPEDIWDTAMAVLSCRKTEEEEQVEASVSGCSWWWAQASPTTAHTVSSHCGGSGINEWPSTVLPKPQ